MSIAHELHTPAVAVPRGMSFRRLGGLGAVGFVVCSILGNEVLAGAGDAPGISASSAEIGRHLTENPPATQEWAGLYVEVLGLLGLVVFAAALWARLRVADRDRPWLPVLAGGGVALAAAIKLASLPAAFAAWWRADDGIDSSVATALLDLNSAAFALMWAPLALGLGAAGVSALRTRALPRWSAVGGCALGVALLVNLPFFASESVPAFMLTLLWLLATGVAMLRRA